MNGPALVELALHLLQSRADLLGVTGRGPFARAVSAERRALFVRHMQTLFFPA